MSVLSTPGGWASHAAYSSNVFHDGRKFSRHPSTPPTSPPHTHTGKLSDQIYLSRHRPVFVVPSRSTVLSCLVSNENSTRVDSPTHEERARGRVADSFPLECACALETLFLFSVAARLWYNTTLTLAHTLVCMLSHWARGVSRAKHHWRPLQTAPCRALAATTHLGSSIVACRQVRCPPVPKFPKSYHTPVFNDERALRPLLPPPLCVVCPSVPNPRSVSCVFAYVRV